MSNSTSQRLWLEAQLQKDGVNNVRVLTADVNTLSLSEQFERVVSVEMFEHVRNWGALLTRILGWLSTEGRVFLHFFAHREFAYPFETHASDDWMGRHFFTGGMMPSRDLLEKIPSPFEVGSQWDVSGVHYAKTAEAWLENLDAHESQVKAVFDLKEGSRAVHRRVQRWRMFFLCCAELFAYRSGTEWLVKHALLRPRATGALH